MGKCIDCDGPNDDGEGYNGRCGNCADVHETTCTVCGGRFTEDLEGSDGAVVHDPDKDLPDGFKGASSLDLDADHVPVGPYD